MSQDIPSAFDAHDHAGCARSVLNAADRQAQDAGLRLTPVRRRVLEILLEEHRALGAYEVLERLSAEGFGAQPPVAYRALDFLVEHGFAHRIRRLNAFAPCMHPDISHSPAFFICETCNLVAEAAGDGVQDALLAAGDSIGFRLSRASVEAVGLCPQCKATAE